MFQGFPCENLLINTAGKWMTDDRVDETWLEFYFNDKAYIISGVGFISFDSNSKLDPRTIKISTWKNN